MIPSFRMDARYKSVSLSAMFYNQQFYTLYSLDMEYIRLDSLISLPGSPSARSNGVIVQTNTE